jgi:hypothetical protein
MGPVLYLLYTSDIPAIADTIIGTFADDTVILSSHEHPEIASEHLQHHLNLLEQWTKKWKIKINESKPAQITFALKKGLCPPVSINNVIIPESSSVRYLGIHIYKNKLSWKEHIVKKRKHIVVRIKELYLSLGRKSHLNLENKILIYKAVIKPLWTYGIELWGCGSKSGIAIIQRSQSKILRAMTAASWYVSNDTLHHDIDISIVSDVIQERSSKHHERLLTHVNPLMQPLLEEPNCRRLKRRLPVDLK